MKYIICYDISDRKRLYHIAKTLNQNGYRVQKSFFSCELTDLEFHNLILKMISLIDKKEDKIAVYRICERCVAGGKYIGCTVSQFFEKDYMVL